MADVSPAVDASPAAEALDELAAAYDRIQEVEARIDEIGESNVEAAADAYRTATRLLDTYADSATGTGDFNAYVQFQNKFITLVEGLSDDIFGADGFQRASDRMDKRRLNDSDFEFAREAIGPAADAVELLERRDDAYESYRAARHAATSRRSELQSDAQRLRRIRRLGTADLDSSLDPLREPVDAYNTAVRSAFETFRKTQSARELFDLLTAGASRPLVDIDRPPRDLIEYIDSAPAGENPLSKLQEYADYSPSKLDHYVDDPGALRTHVAVHGTYLDRLGPEPLLVEWPPAEAGVLRARLRELAPLVRRLDTAVDVATDSQTADDSEVDDDQPDTAADGEASIEYHRRRLSRLTRTDDYERLREVAVADAELDDEEFKRLASGAIEEELTAVEEAIEAIDSALEQYAVE